MELKSKAELQQELKDLLTETEKIKGNTFSVLNKQVAILNQMETLFDINFEHIKDKDLENFGVSYTEHRTFRIVADPLVRCFK